MSLVWTQWLVVLVFLALRFLALGWLMVFAVISLGILPGLLLGPLILTAYAGHGIPGAAFAIADTALLTAGLCISDFGDTPDYAIPLLRFIPVGDGAIVPHGNRVGSAINSIGVAALLVYAGSVLVMWLAF